MSAIGNMLGIHSSGIVKNKQYCLTVTLIFCHVIFKMAYFKSMGQQIPGKGSGFRNRVQIIHWATNPWQRIRIP